nr:multidrug transporter [uncultured Ruminococcus sp.]
MYQSEEKDWKVFREKLPEWQEAYMERLIKEYAELLSSDKAASEKFWSLDKRIRADRQSFGVRVNEESGSKLKNILTGLIIEHVISLEDLQDFSEELRESTSQWIQTYCKNLAE